MELYDILGVTRDATTAEIKKAYRKLALSFHPDKVAKDEKEDSERKFQLISEAYSILSEPALREKYDENGFEGVNNSKPAGDEYDSKEAFESFFGDANSILRMGLHDCVDFQSRNKATKEQENHVETTQEILLPCSLEEISTGVEKCLKLTRTRFTESNPDRCIEESKVLTIKVDPGVSFGKKFTYKGEGDQSKYSQPPANIVVTIKEEPHKIFKREGYSLSCVKTVSLLEALTECTVKVATITGKTLSLYCPEVIHPNYERRIIGEGLPCAENSAARGDLVIRFKITFPNKLSQDTKQKLRHFFQ